MAQIQVEFPDPLTSYVHSQIATGRYPNIDDYLSDLVRADRQEQESIEQLDKHTDLAEKLDQGLESGAGRQWTPAVLNELRDQVLNRARQS